MIGENLGISNCLTNRHPENIFLNLDKKILSKKFEKKFLKKNWKQIAWKGCCHFNKVRRKIIPFCLCVLSKIKLWGHDEITLESWCNEFQILLTLNKECPWTSRNVNTQSRTNYSQAAVSRQRCVFDKWKRVQTMCRLARTHMELRTLEFFCRDII